MMKVLIAGFSPQSTTAIELIVGSLWSDVAFVKLSRGASLSLSSPSDETQRCSLCIVDLLGLGMALWSATREAELQAFLSGRHAILFVPAGGSDDWLNALQPGRLGPSRIVLQHPASTASLRAAVETLREHAQAESMAEAQAQEDAEEAIDRHDAARIDLPPMPSEPVETTVHEEPAAPAAGDLPRATINADDRDESATITNRLLRDERSPERPSHDEAAQPNASEATSAPSGEAAVDAATDRRAARAVTLSVDETSAAQVAVDPPGEAVASFDTRPLRQRWPDELTVPNEPAGRLAAANTAGGAPAAGFEFMAMTPDESDGRYSAPVVPPHPLVRSDRRTTAFSITGYSLDENAYSALLAACPDIARNPYLNLICNIVMRRSPSELRITTRTSAVFFPAENWVASNISTAFRKRLTQHEMMLQIVQVHQLQEEHAHDRAARLFGRRGDGPRSLDAFMWSLVFTTFEQSPPVSIGDLHFQVHRFPNFARLHKMPDLFSQLSQVCMRQPQSLSGLKRAFSKYDPNLVTLFVACTILSGVATVLQTGSSASTEGVARGKRDPSRTAARRTGLFRSLLDKLF